jgi:hypothetical protein
MKREEFIFTIGYQGMNAVVDGQELKRYKNLSTEGLLEEGQFKAAFCSALYNESDEECGLVLKRYNEHSGRTYSSIQELKRLFGVFDVPADVAKVNII